MVHMQRFRCLAAISAALSLGGWPTSKADVVRYELTFNATWSQPTHPQDFPSNAHFSGLIGGSHNPAATFWENGQLASDGIERMAELGSKSPLTDELQAAIDTGDAYGIISGGGISRSPGVVSQQFEISSTHRLATVVSMIAPSPDWFVGVHGLDLRPNGSWLPEVIVELWPYDAGTDSGSTFTSPNDDTMPRETIRQITEAPFAGAPVLGTFTFRLISLPGDFNDSGVYDAADVDLLCGGFGTSDSRFDLTDDGLVDGSDASQLVEGLMGTRFGDADLDGDVEFDDFTALAGGFGGAGHWADGDFNCDGQVAFPDFVTLADNFGFVRTEQAMSTIPEPSTVVLAGLGCLSILSFRRRLSGL